jgi:hypothetical protein
MAGTTGPFDLGKMAFGGLGQMFDGIDSVKRAWSMFNAPSALVPTLDVDELDKRIADLKAVEQWLNLNVSMLHGTIQGLEIQRGPGHPRNRLRGRLPPPRPRVGRILRLPPLRRLPRPPRLRRPVPQPAPRKPSGRVRAVRRPRFRPTRGRRNVRHRPSRPPQLRGSTQAPGGTCCKAPSIR